jgi:hypothetical protein
MTCSDGDNGLSGSAGAILARSIRTVALLGQDAVGMKLS